MIRLIAICGILALSACETGPTQPKLGVGLGIGPKGVRLVPKVTTNVGGVTVGAGQGGVGVGTNVGGVGGGTKL